MHLETLENAPEQSKEPYETGNASDAALFEITEVSGGMAFDLRQEHVKQSIESIEVIGVCTEICVISNVLLLKTYLPDVPIYADSRCCAGVTPETHTAALGNMDKPSGDARMFIWRLP